MKSFTALALIAATVLATTASANLRNCGSSTNDFIYRSSDYSPSPALPKERLCFNIRGKVSSKIPTDSKVTYTFSYPGKERISYSQDFYGTLTGSPTSPIEPDSVDKLQSCFYFPPQYSEMHNVDVSIRALVEHPSPNSRTDKRVLCVQGN
ncbi:hypothetical protein BGZ94_004413, partial [Podila epigama]